jgi:hypothetical protein
MSILFRKCGICGRARDCAQALGKDYCAECAIAILNGVGLVLKRRDEELAAALAQIAQLKKEVDAEAEEALFMDRLRQNAEDLFRGASEENQSLKNALAELQEWKRKASEWARKVDAVLECEEIRRDREDTIRAERNERG